MLALSIAVLLFSHLRLLQAALVSGQSCIASAASGGTSYFHLGETFAGERGM